MIETIRLFDEDSHQTLFEGCVLSCEQDGDLYKVTLNQTMFFPEEGGQSCDRGTLNDIPVEKVLEEDRVIYHWVKEPLWEGDTVTGCVDWEKRFSDMQQHTGEHIVSGMAPQLIATKGSALRPLSIWIALAITSFPVPVSPVISTGKSVRAIRRPSSLICRIFGSLPLKFSNPFSFFIRSPYSCLTVSVSTSSGDTADNFLFISASIYVHLLHCRILSSIIRFM